MEPDGEREKKRPHLRQLVTPDGFKVPIPDTPNWLPLGTIKTFDVRCDDVLIATYPKAGTSWLQEIAWLICNGVDICEAKKKLMFVRVPFLDTSDLEGALGGFQSLEKWPENKQRVIKTHMPYEAIPQDFVGDNAKGKIIVVARNAKDTCVSYYHFHLMNCMFPDPGCWSEFLSKFYSGELHYGSWFEHVSKYWKEYQKDKGRRIHFVTYEALQKDLPSQIASIAKFLERKLTGEQIAKIAEHCSFESMSKNDKTNQSHVGEIFDFKISKFMRKGKVGDWKNHFTVSQNEVFDKFYEERMKETGVTIPFEIQ